MKVIHLVVIGIIGLSSYYVGFQKACNDLFDYCYIEGQLKEQCYPNFEADYWDYDVMRDTVNPFIKSWYECESVYFN